MLHGGKITIIMRPPSTVMFLARSYYSPLEASVYFICDRWCCVIMLSCSVHMKVTLKTGGDKPTYLYIHTGGYITSFLV